MKTLISNPFTPPQFPSSISRFRSLSPNPPTLFKFPNRKSPPTLRTSSSSSYSDCYGGWDDLSSAGESTRLSGLLNSLGIDERKYAFVYLTGFVCALAVSRVKISTIVVFPACFIVFAVGFSFGIVNGGDSNGIRGLFGSSKMNRKKRSRDEEIKVSVENLRNLVDLLAGFDVKITSLKNNMRTDVDSNRISKRDLISYVENVESLGQSALQAKNVIEGFIDGLIIDTNEISKASNGKRSDQKMEGKGFGISELINGFLGSKPGKVKGIVTKDSREVEGGEHSRVSVVDRPVNNEVNDNVANVMEMENFNKRVFDRDGYIFKDNESRYTKSERVGSVHSIRTQDGLVDLGFERDFRHKRAQETFGHEEKFKKIAQDGLVDLGFDGNFRHKRAQETFGHDEKFKKTNGNHVPIENGFGPSPSSDISDDMMFNGYLVEANALLKQARECLRRGGIEGDVENLLCQSVDLLSKAVDMKPMSLLAVGQLGNAYLLHGELKLKLSRKLRALLARNDLEREVADGATVVDYLVSVCEECEELLVKAGRKYRVALSIDGDDMRALYNWGLALSFRAQLIADVGPEAAFDADKVYLAAIDKFDAMMSKSNSHTPDALFRWGVALQQRSRLRTRNSREKVKLLSQAKRLYEDALLMDSNNRQVRKALSTCVSELDYKAYDESF